MRLKCERLDDYGRGICTQNGKITFVRGVLPGEECEVDIIVDKKKYMIGKLKKIYNKSDMRTCTKCIYKDCGCHINYMNYSETLKFKKQKVKNILKKFANTDIDLDIIPSDNIYKYRNKVSLKVKNGMLGYYKNESHEIIDIDKCLIASDNINEIISILKRENLSKVSSIVIKDMDEIMVCIDGDINIEKLKKKATSIYINDELVYGKDKIINSIGDYKFYVSPNTFFQVNNNITLKLYEKVLEYCGKGDRCLDLFCGSGTISIFLSKFFKEVIGIELNKEAVKCANDNLPLNGVKNVTFLCKDANDVSHKNIDVIVVDPARAGLSLKGVKNILKSNASRVVYISCNPISLARDLNLLNKYSLKKITIFDMFPWTYHIETVTLLERK